MNGTPTVGGGNAVTTPAPNPVDAAEHLLLAAAELTRSAQDWAADPWLTQDNDPAQRDRGARYERTLANAYRLAQRYGMTAEDAAELAGVSKTQLDRLVDEWPEGKL